MSEQDIFNTPTQEAAHLASALGEVKALLRDVQRQIASIEARAKRAFPSAFPKPPSRAGEPVEATGVEPTMSAEQAMSLYDEIVGVATSRGLDAASARLNELCLGDLNLLRKELGVSSGKRRISKIALTKAILGRVNESVLLTKHTNRRELLRHAEAGDAGSGGKAGRT